MPTIQRINKLKKIYSQVDIRYFGSITFLMPLLVILLGKKSARHFSDRVDQIFRIDKSAFKFVMIAKV